MSYGISSVMPGILPLTDLYAFLMSRSLMLVHVLVGLLIGGVLLAPLVLGWDDIFEQEE